MLNVTLPITPALHDYLFRESVRESDLLRRLREETEAHPRAGMQIAPEQGQFMALLVRLMQARRIVEVGTFTGYSSICMASAMPPDGRLIACDVSEEFTAVARGYWAEAGLTDRIELRLGPAAATLERMIAGGEPAVDLVFIDADKTGYDTYYEQALRLLRPGGLILIDNTLWDGRVADPAVDDPDTVAIRRLNHKLRHDSRIALSLVPIGDGLTLALKL